MSWINDISLLEQDFFSSFRGQLYENLTMAEAVYQVTTGTWVSGSPVNGKGRYRQNLDRFLTQAGNVRFQTIGSSHDLFYNQEVRVTDSNLLYEEPFAFQDHSLGDYEFWINGTKHGNPDLGVCLCNPVIFGIYEDDYNRILNAESEYEVTIYIHYETE